jgi:hypothetical protein
LFFSIPPLGLDSKTARRRRPHVHQWNVDSTADLKWLAGEQQLVLDLPEAERHLIPMALFAARLRAKAKTDLDRMAWMTFEAETLRESYKMTTDITAGWTALRLFWEAAMLVRGNPLAEARTTLNVARAAYSILALTQPLVLGATEDGDLLREIGLSAAHRSLVLFEAGAGGPGAADQLLHVWHVMGNICATGSSRELLVEARQHYEQVLAKPGLAVDFLESIVASLRRVDAELTRLSGTGGA